MTKKTAFLFLVLTVIAISLSACATSKVQPENREVLTRIHAIDQARMATMIIYRPRIMGGAWLRPTMKLDNEDLANIGNGKVFISGILPGIHMFEMDDNKSCASADVGAIPNRFLSRALSMR